MKIEKTNRMNSLFEFYSALLTKKQANYIELHYANDYSLGEIAEEFEVSRQAVSDNIKRAEKILENYEQKLQLLTNYLVRRKIIKKLQKKYQTDDYLVDELTAIQKIEDD